MVAIHEADPKPGYYKLRRGKDQPWQPVAIWRKDGELLCRVGAEMADPFAVWTWCAGHGVPKDAALFAFENKYWPNEPPPVGHNLPPSDDPFEALTAEIKAKRQQAEQWLAARPTITTQADADYATNAQRELLALVKNADAMFKAEKAPLLAATKACDDKWHFREAVNAVAVRLRQVYERFMVAEERRLQVEAAAKLKAEQEHLEKLKADDPVAFLTSPEPELPLAIEPVKVQAGGGIGRRAGLKTVWVPTVHDYLAAAGHFIQHPDLKAAIDKLVNHAVRDSKGTAQIPGVTVQETRAAA